MIILPKVCLKFKICIKLCNSTSIFKISQANFNNWSKYRSGNPSTKDLLDATFLIQLGFSETQSLKLMSNKFICKMERDQVKYISNILQELGFSLQDIYKYPNILTITSTKAVDHRFKALEECGIKTKDIDLKMIREYSKFVLKDIKELKEKGIIEEHIDVATNILSYSDMPADMITCNISESQPLEDTQLINNIYVFTEHPEYFLNNIDRFPLIGLKPLSEAIKICPRIIMKSHEHIEEILQILKEYKISPEALDMKPDVLTLSIATVRQRLKQLYDDPVFRPLFHHRYLLKCVVHFKKVTDRHKLLTDSKWRCYSLELLTNADDKFDNRLKMGADTTKGCDVVHYLHKELNLEPKEVRTMLSQHPVWHFVPVSTIGTTLRFLLDTGFSNTQICDALPVLLYPKDNIERSLKSLESLPNVDCCREQTSHRLRPELLLQLVLYSLEKPFHFTGNGVWGSNQPPTIKPNEETNKLQEAGAGVN